MPPSSCNDPGDTSISGVNNINPAVKEEQQSELSPSLIHYLVTEHLQNIIWEAIIYLDKILINSSACSDITLFSEKFNSQCNLLGHTCGNLGSSVAEKASLVTSKFGLQSPVWQKSGENQETVQHGMAQHDSRAGCDDNQNDSGFGSGGFATHEPAFDSKIDLKKLEKNDYELSQCCFYYGSTDSKISKDLLKKQPTGTFLIRDSSDPRYLYSMSVKTEKGATSVRILYNKGLFQFDSDERIRDKLPQFDSVLALLDFHVMVTRDGSNKSWQWEEMSGRKSMKVLLTKPLMNSVPSLSHLSRVRINQCLDNSFLPEFSVHRLPRVSEKLKEFLEEYPYRI